MASGSQHLFLLGNRILLAFIRKRPFFPWHGVMSSHIGDFTRWKDRNRYRKALERLLRDLKATHELGTAKD